MLLRPHRVATSRSLLVSTATGTTRRHRTIGLGCLHHNMSTTTSKYAFLQELGLSAREPGVCDGHAWFGSGPVRQQVNPATGEVIGEVQLGSAADYEQAVQAMGKAKAAWASTPAPVRGEVVRRIGNRLREKQHALGQLVSAEMGKILAEGVGEVQESVDICDFAVGLSRALNGSIIPSERPGHLMMERWNPLKGHVGIISAFNFPNAVFFWNLALSLICGNTNLWKPAESTSLVAIASTKIIQQVLQESGHDPAIATLVCGTGAEVGERLVADPRVELVSFTGSTQVGRLVNRVVAGRFGKAILELGGNNALIIDASADLEMAVRAVLFGAVGTAGQRCTTTRRLLLHQDVYDAFLQRLIKAYGSVKIGDPLDAATLCGPLHNLAAVEKFEATVARVQQEGGKVLVGGKRVAPGQLDPAVAKGFFVEPTIVAVVAASPALN